MQNWPIFLNFFVNFLFFHFWLFKRTLFYQSSTYVNVFLIIPELDPSFGREVFLFYKNVHIIIQFSRFFVKVFKFFVCILSLLTIESLLVLHR